MFGGDTGDRPGEFQTWVEQLPLPEKLSFPQGYRDLRYNPEKGVLGIVTGVGTARAAASIMALGMDRRFDLSRAYWLVAGIAGVNPNEASIGSAAWAEWVVDGDLGFEIDAREIPAGWPTGFIPLGRAHPYEEPATDIDKQLTAWTAYWTAGKGRFVMTAMEDTGIAQSLTFLAKAGRADIGRLMVLRTGSNYQMPYSGRSAADHIAALKRGEYPALTPAFAAAYRVGSVVVQEIVGHWDKYADTIPSGS
jgi:purine nucleoside permease